MPDQIQKFILVSALLLMTGGFLHDKMSAQDLGVVAYQTQDNTRRIERIEGKIDWVLTACAATLFAQLAPLVLKKKP